MFGKYFPESGNGPARHPFMSLGPERFNPAPAATEIAEVASGGSIAKNLDRIQQILNVVERTVPYLEEYGPMVKNLPKMYQMMKAFKELEKDEQEDEKTEAEATASNQETATEQDTKEEKEIKTAATESTSGLSKPKLFI